MAADDPLRGVLRRLVARAWARLSVGSRLGFRLRALARARQAAAIRRSMGPPQKAGDPLAPDRCACLEGALTFAGEAGGKLVLSFDGQVASALCTAASEAGPAESLVAEGACVSVAAPAEAPRILLLRPPILVRVGSRETLPTRLDRMLSAVRDRVLAALGAGARPGLRVALRALEPGDPVLVRGVVRTEPAPESAPGYRLAGRQLVLAGAGPDSPVEIAFLGSPRITKPRRHRPA